MSIYTVFPINENGEFDEFNLPQDFSTMSEAVDFAKANYERYIIEECS